MQLWRIYHKRYACTVYWIFCFPISEILWTSICLLRYDCQLIHLDPISGFACGALAAVWGRKKSILFFNSFFAISYLLILLSDNPFLLALSFFLTGMARGATSNFCNTSINELAPGKASLLNGLHAMFAIRSFFLPVIVTGTRPAMPLIGFMPAISC